MPVHVTDFDTDTPVLALAAQLAPITPPSVTVPQRTPVSALPVTSLCNGSIMLFHNDCFNVLKHLRANTVSMVFADLPYGTTQNQWDKPLDLTALWVELQRTGKLTTPYVFTAHSPYNIILGSSNLPMLKYDWIWHKGQGTGHLNAKKQPLRNHEHILVFYAQQCTYNPQMELGTPYQTVSAYSANRSTNYGMQEQVETNNDGTRYPKTVLTIKRDKKRQHPTQKPTELLEYLISTYTNPGDLVVDPTMGSGTTAVACKHLGRRCIGIEASREYFDIAVNRVINE